MPFYDMHVHTNLSIGEDSVDEMANFAKRLGLSGIAIVRYYTHQKLSELPKIEDIDLVNTAIIKPNSAEELATMAQKIRNDVEMLTVHGGDYDVNRAACENSMIDILAHPELGRKDSGLDHICAKAARENGVAIEVNFREVLESYKKRRVFVLSAIKRNIKLCRNYDVKIITTSGAVNRWGLRSGRELAAISNLLGMDLGTAIDSASTVPEEILRVNREKLAGTRWEGVSIVEE
jgi:ribonuclease P/MRP protein subunit RPP1